MTIRMIGSMMKISMHVVGLACCCAVVAVTGFAPQNTINNNAFLHLGSVTTTLSPLQFSSTLTKRNSNAKLGGSLFAATDASTGATVPSSDTEGAAVSSSLDDNAVTLTYTHLEINSMLLSIEQADKLSILIDPIAGQLDFGIAPLYRANKKILSPEDTYRLIDEAKPSHVLLTQGLDDHTHLATIRELVKRHPNMRYIVPPSAYDKVLGTVPRNYLTLLRHGESLALNEKTKVTATVGSLVGPPWQEREHGYLLEITSSSKKDNDKNEKNSMEEPFRIYYEPHGDTDPSQLRLDDKPIKADICILPVTEQSLPAALPQALRFPLVHGPERMREIVTALGARLVVPLCNGDVKAEGALTSLVASRGSLDSFAASLPAGVDVARPVPGQALTVTAAARR